MTSTAFFYPTQFVYYFPRNIQDPTDMTKWSGKPRFHNYEAQHVWTHEDFFPILKSIQKQEDELGLPLLRLDAFAENLEGTKKLYSELVSYLNLYDGRHYKYLLGCLIFHQLLYAREDLVAVYDL